MSYDVLLSFVVFAEHLNFTRAAKELHITQPALHAQIRKLAESVGVALYRRRGRELVLTDEGRKLASFGREMSVRGREVLSELLARRERGPVVLASGQGAYRYLLGAAIRRFPKDRWPLRAVSMSAPETVDALRDARADVGVAALRVAPEDLDVREVRSVGQLVVVPRGHRLARRRKLSCADLDGENVVAAPAGSPHRVMLEQALVTAGARWNVAVEATGWDLMLQFARYGLGIAVVNDFCPVPRGFTGIPLAGAPAISYFVLTRRSLRHSGADALAQLILETAERSI